MSEGPVYVLDASALLAYIKNERGWERVEAALRGSLMSTVNFSEVLAKMVEAGEDPEELTANFQTLIQFVPFTAAHALTAAQLRPQTRALGLSLGDRACLALGLERGATVLTADKAWDVLEKPHQIEVLR